MRLQCSPVVVSDAQHRTFVTRNATTPSVSNSSIDLAKDKTTNSSVFCVPPAYLEELHSKLNSEDRSNRPLRRALGFMDILNKVSQKKRGELLRQQLWITLPN